ncbi:DUF4340 domain-containing protein [Coraliomargarita akajimensis]|uniref:DUF4340 domain-containing protein n=1 Tax=Coraliomargarita akajimensis (strain DSM 45221 / IAM 15411 / JCM 23193 / KCTC 12865 / 04OKA010-24) TaxID=583355 RepID=D5EMU5_CORAD|nr:DUF4340 domain-containing protein [Coraliomargarita akajimensis]ADE55335.1 conserved hypothetical protein [Coraliomargarita akajimensis DSM 45221]
MRIKFTLILLVLNAIAFGAILFLGRQPSGSDQKDSSLAAIISKEVIEADRLVITELQSSTVLERDGTNWIMREPMQWTANFFAVNRIINQLQFLEEQAVFSVDEITRTGQSLADYGLDEPGLTLEIANESHSVNLAIGSQTEIGQNVYILGPQQEKIYVVSSELIDSLVVGQDELKSRQIFDIPVFEVDALSVQHRSTAEEASADLKVHIRRTKTGWIFEAPLSAEADPSLVSNTINSLTSIQVEEFKPVAGDPLLRGLESPSMRVTLNGNKRYQTLLIGNPDLSKGENPPYYAQLEGSPTVFTVPSAPFDELRQAQQSLRERNFMGDTPATISAINISEGNDEVRLRKLETGGWQVTRKTTEGDVKPHRASDEEMVNFMRDLANLRATGFAVDAPTPADLNSKGFTSPRRKITLSFDDATQPLTLEFAHPTEDNENLYARTDRSEYIYKVDRRTTLQKFPLNDLHYRTKTLNTLPEAAKITRLKLEDLDSGTTIFNYAPKESEGWETMLEQLEVEEYKALRVLLQSIREFVVSRYLTDGYSESYVRANGEILPWSYRLSAEILLPGGDTDKTETRSYVFTKRLLANSQPGASKRDKVTFNNTTELIEALGTFTNQLDFPEEVSGKDVPSPEPLPPVPNPEPVAPQPEPTEEATTE